MYCGLLQRGQITLCKITLQEGCQFKGALLPQHHSQSRKPFKINVPAATVQHWSAPEEAAAQSKNDMSVMCLPHSKSEPAIDAISSPALYWQVSNALSSLYRHIERGSTSMHACDIGSIIVAMHCSHCGILLWFPRKGACWQVSAQEYCITAFC